MSKTTMGTKLPRKLVDKMEMVGEQIRLARLRRDLSIAQVAERATCSPVTISRVEKRCSDCRHRHQPYNCQEYSFK